MKKRSFWLLVSLIFLVPVILGTITIKDYNWSNRNILTSLLPGNDTLPIAQQVHVLHTVSIDSPHHELHEGQSFYFPVIDTLSAGEQTQFLITSQAAGESRAHFLFQAGSEGNAVYSVWKAPTVVTGVQAVTILNRDRNSSNSSNLTVETVTDLASGGTLLVAVASSGGGQTSAGVVRSVNEIILKDDTEYLFDITSGAANNVITVTPDWYEPDEAP